MKQLDREGVAYDVVDIEHDAKAADYVMSVNGGNQTVPTVVFGDGHRADQPEPGAGQGAARGLRSADRVVRAGEDGYGRTGPDPLNDQEAPSVTTQIPAHPAIDAVMSTAASLLGMEIVFLGGLTEDTFTFERVHAKADWPGVAEGVTRPQLLAVPPAARGPVPHRRRGNDPHYGDAPSPRARDHSYVGVPVRTVGQASRPVRHRPQLGEVDRPSPCLAARRRHRRPPRPGRHRGLVIRRAPRAAGPSARRPPAT
jgi:hypothetical protein